MNRRFSEISENILIRISRLEITLQYYIFSNYFKGPLDSILKILIKPWWIFIFLTFRFLYVHTYMGYFRLSVWITVLWRKGTFIYYVSTILGFLTLLPCTMWGYFQYWKYAKSNIHIPTNAYVIHIWMVPK